MGNALQSHASPRIKDDGTSPIISRNGNGFEWHPPSHKSRLDFLSYPNQVGIFLEVASTVAVTAIVGRSRRTP